jgi:predicted alpha/beta hydrolase family esterase
VTGPSRTNSPEPTVVFVPGLRDHVADHWQTLLAAELDRSRTVAPLEHDRLSLPARVAALNRVLTEVTGPVVLVAHSAGVMITVHWARQHGRAIAGALLATPPDLATPLPDGYPTPDELDRNGWFPIPADPLPFPSIVAASTNDPLAGYDRVAAMARDWGSRLVDIGPAGHLNPASGHGPWPQAHHLLTLLTQPSPAFR